MNNKLQLQQQRQVKIYDRITRRPQFVGQTFSGKSMTIPGQDMTPLEILNQFKRGIPPSQVYLDHDIDQFQRMDQMEKIDFLNSLKREQLEARQSLLRQVDEHKQRIAQQPPPDPTIQ